MKPTTFQTTLILFLILFNIQLTNAQGCVAIRHFSSCVGNSLENNLLGPGDIQIGSNYRYFKSFRHFRGTEEEVDRVANETEVVNHAHAWDFFITYGITDRLYTSATLPFVINTRSSLYEHGRNERNTTFSRGLTDVRLGVGYWVFNPANNPNGNLALGLGIKLPTGNYNASDIFYNVGPEGSPQVRPVDQSIQPGDGGFGITLDFQLYKKIFTDFYLYAGGFYLINPRETNGTRTFRETLSPILENEAIMAVPDQFSSRLGLSYAISPLFSTSLGARFEGVPVKDLMGGNKGFRRPGNVLSLDPGLAYMANNLSINLNVPIALRRDRPQSVTDLETQMATGNPRNGDAAFADYAINLGITFRLPNKKENSTPDVQSPF